jgi:hypothetical protein
MRAIIEPTPQGTRMPKSTTTNREGTTEDGTDSKEGDVQASSRSGSTSPKMENREGTTSRKQGTFCRALAAQYAHRSPTLSLQWPGQPGTRHGTSNRMPQTVHFASMRSSWVQKMIVSSLPGRRSSMRLAVGWTIQRGESGGHTRQDKHGFPLITCRYAAMGTPSCLLASR